MINKQFEEYKVMRELKRSGTMFTFLREQKNEFGETVSDVPTTVGMINGLYHENNSQIQVKTGDVTQIQTKKLPSVLCLHSDTNRISLQVGDYTILNGKKLLVTGIVNIQEWNTISDISLEVFAGGDASVIQD